MSPFAAALAEALVAAALAEALVAAASAAEDDARFAAETRAPTSRASRSSGSPASCQSPGATMPL
jgi:hypothetical protein